MNDLDFINFCGSRWWSDSTRICSSLTVLRFLTCLCHLLFWDHCSVNLESSVFSEGACEEVIQFFQRPDEDTNCEIGGSPGWLLLKTLLLLTADSSVSDN